MTLHLQAGPIDLLIQAWGAPHHVDAAYAAARAAFAPILPTLAAELPHLRRPLPTRAPNGPIARAMHNAVHPYTPHTITPMAAVAGAVADHILAAMTAAAWLDRALVNNRGDIALHLAPGQALRIGLVTDVAHPTLDATLRIEAHTPTRGVATSGRACKGQGGRSFSFGIADSVTILAATAAQADAAATIVANAVDLPGHPAIHRRPARDIDPDSDLGARLVTWQLGPLTPAEIAHALAVGCRTADSLVAAGLIHGAHLALRGQTAAASPIWKAA